MTTYRILRHNAADMLESAIQQHLAMGWELQGGISVAMVGYEYESRDGRTSYDDVIYAQAVILRKPSVRS